MSAVTETMPAQLRAIKAEVSRLQPETSGLGAFQQTWQQYLSRAMQQVSEIHVEADGEAVYLGDLSPGCQACKDGTWDCIFVTMRCNLDCEFCYSPHAIPEDYTGSVFGTTPQQITRNYAGTRITGISFTGGEPLVDAQTLFDWVAWMMDYYPDKYYWIYTNGLFANAANMRRLGQLGVDEVRFNLAATGYDHPTVMRNLASAVRFIPNVTVEIPAIPEHAGKLLACVADWCTLGVRFLNLHELLYEPNTNSASMLGARRAIVTPDGHSTEINPESRYLTLAVMRKVQAENLPISVNDCSIQSKLRQLRGRRRSIAHLTRAPYERLVGDEILESCCAYQGAEHCRFFHPDSLHEMRQRYPDYQFVRLARTAPLSLQDSGRWIAFEELIGARES